jgi:hypothetical protein
MGTKILQVSKDKKFRVTQTFFGKTLDAFGSRRVWVTVASEYPYDQEISKLFEELTGETYQPKGLLE